ncbi:hypothetical protein GC207_15730 [bacterium]|nr:hypothetical protein [bacterium]
MKAICFSFAMWLAVFGQVGFAADSGTRRGTSDRRQSPVDALKDFLASTHETGEIIYTWRLPATTKPIPGLGKPMPEVKVAFWAKWQPDAYFLSQLKSADSLVPPARNQVRAIVGKAGQQPWAYDNGYLELWKDQLSDSATESLRKRQHWALSQLYATLGFGILYNPGSLKWEGNSFFAAPLDSGTLNGHLTVLDSGRPNEIVTAFNGHESRLRLFYDGSNGGDSFPSGYDRESLLPNGENVPGEEVRILFMSLTNSVLPIEKFEPQAILASLDARALSPDEHATTEDSSPRKASAINSTRLEKTPLPNPSITTIVYSNKHDYFIRHNALIPVMGPPEHPPLGWFVVAAVVLVAVPFAFYFYINRKKR